MAGNRIGRINEEIRKELSALLRTVKDPRVSEGMLTITRVVGGTLHAFRADSQVYVSLPGQIRRLEEFEQYAADQAAYAAFTGMRGDEGEANELLDAANYIATRFREG
mgnify:CR=1 FL=1